MPESRLGSRASCSIWHILSCSCCQAGWDLEDAVINLHTVFRGQTEETRSVLWSLLMLAYSSFQGLVLGFSTLLIFHKDLQVSNVIWGHHNFQFNSILGRNSFISLSCACVVGLLFWPCFDPKFWSKVLLFVSKTSLKQSRHSGKYVWTSAVLNWASSF